ncbi:hypothetical protein ACJJTC_005027 [Scirpophaga incertulas]
MSDRGHYRSVSRRDSRDKRDSRQRYSEIEALIARIKALEEKVETSSAPVQFSSNNRDRNRDRSPPPRQRTPSVPSGPRKTACIAALIKKNVNFSWGVEQRAARRYIIECLTSEPVLAIYDPSLPIEVHTDASSIGYGAVMMQVHEGNRKRVVSYFSRLTHGAESRYHSYELETLAVVKALQYFRHYLVGVRFTVTDCNALKLTQRKKDLLPRVARWWVYLQDFDFVLDYRKGSLLSHADYLSRNPVNTVTVQKPQNWARIAQASDEETRSLMQRLSDGQLDPTKYVVKNDILYYKFSPTGENPKLLCFIPKGHRLSLLRIFHDEHDHPGVDKTVDLIIKHFWFPGLRAFALKYITHCLVCLSHKKVARAPFQPIHSWEKPDVPFETVHMDVLGVLPEADGYRYVFIVIDAFSKFCLLYPMFRQESDELKRHVTNFISLFGTPKLIVADRGRMFQSADFLDWINGMGCDTHLITPEMHQSNGQVERYCRTVLNMVRIECNHREQRWPSVLWKLQLVINITKHRTTKCSPLNLLIGIDAATPLIQSLIRDVAIEGSSPNREALREMSRQRVSERLRSNQETQDTYVNQGRKPPRRFELNSLVFAIVAVGYVSCTEYVSCCGMLSWSALRHAILVYGTYLELCFVCSDTVLELLRHVVLEQWYTQGHSKGLTSRVVFCGCIVSEIVVVWIEARFYLEPNDTRKVMSHVSARRPLTSREGTPPTGTAQDADDENGELASDVIQPPVHELADVDEPQPGVSCTQRLTEGSDIQPQCSADPSMPILDIDL